MGRLGRSGAPLVIVLLIYAACSQTTAAAHGSTAPDRHRPEASATSGLEWRPVLTELGLVDPASTSWQTVYKTGFERDADLAGFYVTPQSPMTRHKVVAGATRYRGQRAHRAWLTGATGSEPVDGPNHRGYPTIQLLKRPVGACPSPCLIEFWVRIARWKIDPGEWLSLATFSSDGSDQWSRVVTVNVASEDRLFLFHVPDHGVGETVFQRDTHFPRKRWVRVTTLLDLHPTEGAAAVWQDGKLMSAAEVNGGDGDLDQMHFGLYAAPPLTRGVVWSDHIKVLAPAA